MTADLSSPRIGQDSLSAALYWIDGLLRGPLASSVAVIAVALLGYTMLTGRIPVRDAGRVVLGCFILFGAPLIAQGLITGAPVGEAVPLPHRPNPPPPMLLPAPPVTGAPNPFDPYTSQAAPDQPASRQRD